MGILRILDKKLGDRQILLCKENIEEARIEFRESIKRGFIAFEIQNFGVKKLIHELNTDAEEIIMIPQMVGG